MLPRSSKKHYVFSKLDMVKYPCSNPYKTCRLLRLLRPFLQNSSEKHQKALCLSVTVDGVLRSCKMSKKHWSQSILEHPGKLMEIPYKTCRLWRPLRSFTQNGSRKYQKALGFSLKLDAVLRLCKTSENL